MANVTYWVILVLLLCLQPAWPEQDPDILYINYDWQPYTMNADGTNKKQFMDAFGMRDPDWSPLGGSFVAIGMDQQIHLVNAETLAIERLTDGIGRYAHPRWSPDGKYTAFSYSNYGPSEVSVMDANTFEIISTIESELSDGSNGLDWVIDNDHLVFTRQVGPSTNEEGRTVFFELVVVNIHDQEDLKSFLDPLCPAIIFSNTLYSNLSWSTANQLLAISGCSGLYIASVDEDGVLGNFFNVAANFPASAIGDRGMAWSLDGEHLIFDAISDITGNYEIYVLDVPETLESGEPQFQILTETLLTDSYYYGLTWIIPPQGSQSTETEFLAAVRRPRHPRAGHSEFTYVRRWQSNAYDSCRGS
jgi:WD40 repeat protein